MNLLILCESSGVVREAFRALGHNAVSCDLLPADDGSPHHIQGDALEAMASGSFDIIGMHPPCTYLNGAGIHWNNRGRGWGKTNQSLAFVKAMMEQATASGAAWYLENPVGIISTNIRKATQYVQPYEFGEDASKKTGLWLHKLPPLVSTSRFPGRWVEWPKGSGKTVERWSNQTDSGQNRLAPSDDRWKARSKTYPGIAQAMASQWSDILATS
jgi:hypothetical protein